MFIAITIGTNDLNIPKCRTALAQKSFQYRGADNWNSLPRELRNLYSLSVFKRSLRSHLSSD